MDIITLVKQYLCGLYAAQADFVENPGQFSEIEKRIAALSTQTARDFLSMMLTELNKGIRESGARKDRYTVQRTDTRTLISTVGDLVYEDTLYRSRETGEYIHLLDHMMHLPAHERMTVPAEARLISEATVHSYQHAADVLSLTSGRDGVSKTTVMNKIHALEEELPEMDVPEEDEKRQCEYLYIEADEDHIHRQKDPETSCMIGKLVYLFEGKEEVCAGKKALVSPFYFSGLYPGEKNKALWEGVERYIQTHYDQDYLKRVYISSDGGGWIKAGKDCVYKSCLVADRFHLMKYINRVCRQSGDEEEKNKGRFYRYIWKNNLAAAKKMLTRIERRYGPSKAVDDCRNYFTYNWGSIQRAFHDEHVYGCSAEGHVSNILSDRMSSRPMGWSQLGSDRMCKLRCYVKNYGEEKVLDLVQYRREREFQEQLPATGTDGLIEPQRKKYTKKQREAFVYVEKMQAHLESSWTVRKTLAIREQIGSI